MPIKKVFATQIYSENLISNSNSLKSFCAELRKDCYKIAGTDLAGQNWSEEHFPGGYTSYESIPELHTFNSSFEKLKKHIDQHVKVFAQALDMNLKKHPLSMSSSWINIVGPMGTHGLHLHPLSTISGTVYLDTPKGAGPLKLEDPRLSKMMATLPRMPDARLHNQPFLYFQPKVGKIILFESWLRHEVEQNLGEHDRVSISFNYHW